MKTLDHGEFKKITIECLPQISGLYIEMLEFRSSDEIGGHRLRISLRAQGVTPCVTLSGLAPPPNNWVRGGGVGSSGGKNNNGSGILDFGNVLIGDVITSTFNVLNESSFAVTVALNRVACTGLSEYGQLGELEDRTITGLPVFSYRPERVTLKPGKH